MKDKARTNCLKAEDLNTCYFYDGQRKRRNCILSTINEEGMVFEDPDDNFNSSMQHFQNLWKQRGLDELLAFEILLLSQPNYGRGLLINLKERLQVEVKMVM